MHTRTHTLTHTHTYTHTRTRLHLRYICFHPTLNTVYVVNELSSTVSVFEFNATKAETLTAGSDVSTLRLVQSISTIPSAFPGRLNTCGRIAIDPSGQHVLVSNRGHDSIAVFRINGDTDACGEGGKLSIVSFTHTRGKTPRHFQFDPSGTALLAANQVRRARLRVRSLWCAPAVAVTHASAQC
jgi:6-phosphogluconolactonase